MPNVLTPPSLRALVRRLRRQPSGAVLVYHRVADAAWDPFGQAVHPATFARQLRIARRFGTIVPAGELVARIDRADRIDRAIAVTFDDGYADNLTTAAPIAAELDVPITVFVTVQPVRDGVPFWWDTLGLAMLEGATASDDITVAGTLSLSVRSRDDRTVAMHRLHSIMRHSSAGHRAALLRDVVASLPHRAVNEVGRPMTVTELRQLAEHPGVSIGAHTMTHPLLAALDMDEQRSELSASREALGQMLGAPVPLMAYPFGKPGDLSATTQALARAAGYDAAFTTVPASVSADTNPFAIPRLTMHEWPDEVFASKLEALVGPPING